MARSIGLDARTRFLEPVRAEQCAERWGRTGISLDGSPRRVYSTLMGQSPLYRDGETTFGLGLEDML